jgi:hypothetical protein
MSSGFSAMVQVARLFVTTGVAPSGRSRICLL